MMIVYAITVAIALAVLMVAFQVYETTNDPCGPLSFALVFGGGFFAFPVLNVVSTVVLVALILDENEKQKLGKYRDG